MDANESRKLSLMLVLFFQVLAVTLPGCFLVASQQLPIKKPALQTLAAKGHGFSSSLVFPVTGNVYPLGYFSVSLSIGNPPKPFTLDIDTGSDLTWVQCDAPCTGCTVPKGQLYKPAKSSIVPCKDPLCAVINGGPPCKNPNEQCDFKIQYADSGSVIGVLVRDYFPLRFINGTLPRPNLTFGCAYDIDHGQHNPPPTTGVLGLGKSAASISSQLGAAGLTQNVIGQCYSAKGGGFLFIGNDPVPSSGVSWVPMLQNTMAKHYASGPADLLFGGKPTGLKGLNVIFDSGSSFTYFNSAVYEAILNLLSKDLNGKPIRQVQDPALPVCWKGAKPFKVLSDVKSYFKPFTLSFTSTKNAQLQLTLENYLIISEHGNACLGILNGAEAGLGNYNLVGDISMLDKLVIYDNERKQIGWTSANCNRIPKS
ncbi:hypothetical protein SLEP1_g45712 [Rubroshorea leprosula]|uniref:Aspartic proteinase Asp1 n=1 Tax=Rubroshorea leprosula TaxID=152421 RepID=A0AAV5LM84_9ROSI|nr:hypothetical protein SLEP1_g45712 [Rubroshorea leprosula]